MFLKLKAVKILAQTTTGGSSFLFLFFKFLLIKAGWVICFNQVQVIRLNMGITGKNMMAYGMQKVRADDLKIPVVFDSVQL